jgi:CubicO group peptidase (beta-lactamase class C family)
MASLEEQFQAACAVREIPSVVLIASGAGGKFQYQKAFGQKSPTEEMRLDTTFIMASCTKLLTSIAALQCVERGQIALDVDLAPVIPEFKDIEVLTGFTDAGEPVLKRAENKITLR